MDAKRKIKGAVTRARISIGWHIDHWFLGPAAPFFAGRRWKKAAEDPTFRGVTEKERRVPLIVSLTSFPGRIELVPETIRTLLTQTVKPDKIILWLTEEEFPGKEADLPETLKELVGYGLTIGWCRNMRSYNKLIYTLEAYPDAVIVTVDDDILYHPDLIRRLYDAYRKDGRDSKFIYCHRITKITMEGGTIGLSVGGYDVYDHPSYLNMLTGVGGVLYPPHVLDEDVTRNDLFRSLIPTNDDVWFWLMAVKAGTRVKVLKRRITMLPLVPGSQKESLISVNRVDQGDGENLTVKQMRAVLDHYPEVRERLEEEWKREEPWI